MCVCGGRGGGNGVGHDRKYFAHYLLFSLSQLYVEIGYGEIYIIFMEIRHNYAFLINKNLDALHLANTSRASVGNCKENRLKIMGKIFITEIKFEPF